IKNRCPNEVVSRIFTDEYLAPTLSIFADITPPSIHPLLRLDILHIIRERVLMHRPVIDPDRAILPTPAREPRGGVFHPVLVVTLREVLMRVGAAGFLAVVGAVEGYRSLTDEIVQLK